MKEMSDLFCSKAAVGGNYNLTRDRISGSVSLYGERVGKAERGPAAGAVFDWGTFLKFE